MEKENVDTDYSCGNCGWYGWVDQLDEDNCCPKCGSERVGMITGDDFEYGNALFGKLWHGKEVLNNSKK